jgi:NarL family two-component system response regulator LiaR
MGRADPMVGQRIRVLVVDEHAGLRRAIATFLEAVDDLELAGQAANGEQAICLCASALPDVVLMDVTLPDMTSAAAVQAIHLRCPSIQVIAMCTFQEEDLAAEVLLAGAASYLLKNVSAVELANAIRRAYAGQGPSAKHEQRAVTV